MYFTIQSFALDKTTANQFIQNLIHNVNISRLADETVIEKSKRLGISYKGYPEKWLIGNDIDMETKERIRTGKLNYSYCILEIDSIYSKLNLTITGMESLKTFYFKNNKYIFPEMYFTSDWTEQTSEFFNFHIYDPDYFNEHSKVQLDNFVYDLINIFDLDSLKVNKLKKEKIDYILCEDSSQIEMITGYPARGQFLLSSDAIISSFNCHYHEITHFFINYVLEENNLYTNPFILEGLAVALGGRGGKVPEVIMDMGYYLEKTGYLNAEAIQTYQGFYNNNASLSYPVAGLYIKFLLEYMTLEDFLELYSASGAAEVDMTQLKNELLPADSEWNEFLKEYKQYSTIIPHDPEIAAEDSKNDSLIVTESNDYYYFWAKRVLTLLVLPITIKKAD